MSLTPVYYFRLRVPEPPPSALCPFTSPSFSLLHLLLPQPTLQCRTTRPLCLGTTKMTSAGGPSSWSQTSVHGSEMLIPMIGAKSSTNCESEAIRGVRMQVRTPAVPAGHCPVHLHSSKDSGKVGAGLLSVPPLYESRLLLLCPQTIELGEIVVCFVHLTPWSCWPPPP